MRESTKKSFKYAIYTGPILSIIAILLLSKEVVTHSDGTVRVIRGWSAVQSFLKHDSLSFFSGILIAMICTTVLVFIISYFLGVWISHKKLNLAK